ncbi:MAG: hypothetical protein ACLGQH_12605, partial [Acidobacteriota bacterium]
MDSKKKQPFYHFLGWRDELEPNKDFLAQPCSEQNSDVCKTGINPIERSISQDRDERQIFGSPDLNKPNRREPLPGLETCTAKQRGLIRAAFDQDFYLTNNTDLAGLSPTEALAHYLRFGWREGRDPSQDFSTRFYLAQN